LQKSALQRCWSNAFQPFDAVLPEAPPLLEVSCTQEELEAQSAVWQALVFLRFL
jgi:hypothetical protein